VYECTLAAKHSLVSWLPAAAVAVTYCSPI